MSQSHRIKGVTTDEAFQEQCSLWERGTPAAADFFHAQDPTAAITHKRKRKTL